MKITRQIVNKIVCASNISSEALPGVTLVEIAGFQRVLIERHHGVIAYGDKEIRVKVRNGVVCVCGEFLKLACMTNENLVITGEILSISLLRESGK